jgi:hypothetical protein
MSDLYEYGIHQEDSDIRVHVCPHVRRVYVFPTENACNALSDGNYQPIDGYQDEVNGRTSQGYNVPPSDIPSCIALTLREVTWEHLGFDRKNSTSTKGAKAVRLVSAMVRRGMIPVPGAATTKPELEISGTDIVATFDNQIVKIQVKCDFKGGAKHLGGFGLFLQTHERNPRGLHDGEQSISVP